MTEFEKRFPDSVGNSGSQITISRKEAWKAALELIRETGDNAQGPEHNCYYEIMDVIDKELGEE